MRLWKRGRKYKKSGDHYLYVAGGVEYRMDLAYVDSKGRRYFEYMIPGQMPTERYLATLEAEKGSMLNLTIPDLINIQDQIIASVHKNPNEAVALAIDLKAKAMRLADGKAILTLAATLYLCEEEDPTIFSAHWREEKLKRWKEDDKARSFFLTLYFQRMNQYADLSPEDLVNYINQGGDQVKRIVPKKVSRSAYKLPNLSESGVTKPGLSEEARKEPAS